MGIPDALQELLATLPAHIVLELLRQGLCLRCVFRFLNIRDAVYSIDLPTPAEVYAKISTSIEHHQQDDSTSLKNSELDVNITPEQTCLTCLGVLQRLDTTVGPESQVHKTGEGIEKNAVSCLSKAINDRGHSVDKFCLEVTLPALILLRERGLWCYLKEQYKEETLYSGQDINDHIVSLKEAVKWSLLERLEHVLSAKFDTSATLRIALVFKHSGSPAEVEFLAAASTGGDAKRKRNGGQHDPESQGFAAVVAARAVTEAGESLAAVQRSLASMNNELFMRRYQCPPSKVALPCEIAAVCWRNPVFVGGRYLKFSRNVSQSRWLIEDERMGEGSVQEIIGDVVMPYYKADSYKFHAAGREDIDVRMLGTGRPFIIELINARRIPSASEIEKAEADINGQKEGWVKVKGLRQVGIEVCALMRQGEVEKQKEYVAVVWLDRPVTPADFKRLSNLKELEIQQKTPVRVLHRRSPLIRPRTIHWMRCEPLNGSENYFLLHLCTQAGTYIKEFVHGDLGRTYPNVGSLLDCAADILQLDVMDVKMEFE